jgi:hypothetical protein
MKMLFDITLPHEPFNTLARQGIAGKKLAEILDATKPEAIYFTEQDGKRGAVAVMELAEPSSIPSLCEPWFLTFNAEVKCRIMMMPDDLRKSGLDDLGKKWA